MLSNKPAPVHHARLRQFVVALAWQCFDLRVAHKLNLLANEHKGKARELRSQEKDGTPAEETGPSNKDRSFR